MPIVTTSVKQLVQTAKSRIEEIPAKEALALAMRDDVVIVDIRDVRERQKLGFIPDSVHAPRGMLEFWVDPASPYHREIFASGRLFIFFCAMGWRAALATAAVQDMGLTPVASLEGGFKAWQQAGGPVTPPERTGN